MHRCAAGASLSDMTDNNNPQAPSASTNFTAMAGGAVVLFVLIAKRYLNWEIDGVSASALTAGAAAAFSYFGRGGKQGDVQ